MPSSSEETLPPAIAYVVDDDDTIRGVLVAMLEGAGLDTRAFASAEQFIAAYAPGHPGCLVLDLRMPGQTGLDLQAWLAEHDPALAIVFISGDADIESAVTAMRAGAVDFLVKPFTGRALVPRVRQALARTAQARAEPQGVESDRRRVARLTARELETCELLLQGLATKQIALRLGISTRTAEHHRASLLRKMEAANAVELARKWHSAHAPNQART